MSNAVYVCATMILFQGKGEMFTFFLTGEDLSQRMRRMSQDKPELFLLNGNADVILKLPEDDCSVSMNSQILLDENNLPIVIVTNTISYNSAPDSPLCALHQL